MSHRLRHLILAAMMGGTLSCAASTPREDVSASRTKRTSSGESAPGESIPSDESPSALRIPRIMTTMPESGVVDLGPVLIQSGGSQGLSADQALLQAADRLGADAFLVDSKRLKDAYRFRTIMGKDLMDRSSNPVSTDDLIYHGPYHRTGDPSPTKQVFYHALKFVAEDAPRCVLDEGLGQSRLTASFVNVATVQEQFQMLNTLFAQGVLSASRYKNVRAACVAQIEEASR
ncbi:MAG: hypothetical protein AAF219_00290 [Myxococcota bacterium]